MKEPPLGPGGKDITWPDQVAPRGRKASSTRKIKPETRNLNEERWLTTLGAKDKQGAVKQGVFTLLWDKRAHS